MDTNQLEVLVREYQAEYAPQLDAYLAAYRALEWPSNVIYDAVYGKSGEIHSHQWRLRFRPEKLEQACSALMRNADKLRNFTSFARLLDCVEDVTTGVDHFGELAVYDTSLRLGAHLGLWPKVVYLHAGTKKGYEALLGDSCKLRQVELDDLPEPLRILEPHHAENFLCIYKDYLSGGTEKPKGCLPAHAASSKRSATC